MLPTFLVPETTIHENGAAGAVELPPGVSNVLITFGIKHVIEQQSLLLMVQRSADAAKWESLIDFPEKFYTGVSSVLIDCTSQPDTKFLRAEWKVNRWGRGSKIPSFTFYVFAEAV